MKRTVTVLAMAAALACCFSCSAPKEKAEPGLKDATKGYFYMGTALNGNHVIQSNPEATKAILQHFNAISPENCMKCIEIHPYKDVYEFTLPDAYVEFGLEHNMFIHGHTLIWHSQLAPWFCSNEDGSDVSPEELERRIVDHVTTIVSRYKGKIDSWDVVNECVLDNGEMRPTKFYQILGDRFIEIAFKAAAAADPDCELYLNDYNMTSHPKREKYVEIIKRLQAEGIKIDGMGLQGHWGLTSPSLDEIQKSIDMFADLGLKVSITELDMSILPGRMATAAVEQNWGSSNRSVDPYDGNFPQENVHDWNYRMQQFFQLFKDNAEKLERVTVWGVSDNDTWRNYIPITGRKDYATLLDRNYQIKPVDFWIMKNY